MRVESAGGRLSLPAVAQRPGGGAAFGGAAGSSPPRRRPCRGFHTPREPVAPAAPNGRARSCARGAAPALSDAELLALVVGSGAAGRSALRIGRALARRPPAELATWSPGAVDARSGHRAGARRRARRRVRAGTPGARAAGRVAADSRAGGRAGPGARPRPRAPRALRRAAAQRAPRAAVPRSRVDRQPQRLDRPPARGVPAGDPAFGGERRAGAQSPERRPRAERGGPQHHAAAGRRSASWWGSACWTTSSSPRAAW